MEPDILIESPILKSTTAPFKINIIGAGSMGHLWAGYLSKLNCKVVLYNKTKSVDESVLLRLNETKSSFVAHYRKFNEWQPCDLSIITVKAGSLERVCQQIAQQSSKPPVIILLMNGLGLLEIANAWLPNLCIYQASTTHGALFSSSAVESTLSSVVHTGNGKTSIGSLDTDSGTDIDDRALRDETILEIVELLNTALPVTEWSKDHQQILWTKLLINSVINPLTAIYDVSNGQLVEDYSIVAHAERLTRELEPVIKKYLTNISWQQLFEIIKQVAIQTAKNSSSMRQDILLRRKTEIEFISGYILKKALEFGWSLPEHQTVVNQIIRLELQSQNSVTN
ncbi:MAG: ketopantoate reductase family protein [Kangiellaceae bacterium]|nr:ketopantoate reductase family protein [Kangiellaceae bacterium]